MRVTRQRMLARAGLAAILVLAVAQLIPVDRSNPPIEKEIEAAATVKAILRRACYDCHSNETAWPWYSHVAPVSWLVASDVHEGREELNFSTWNRYGQRRRRKKLKESWEEVAEGEMPPWPYLLLHPGARLSAAQRDALHEWTLATIRAAKADGQRRPSP